MCGTLLEPVTDLADLVGFRAIEAPGAAAELAQSSSHRRVSDRLEEFVTRRAEVIERGRAVAEHRLDGGDDPIAVAVALPLPPASG